MQFWGEWHSLGQKVCPFEVTNHQLGCLSQFGNWNLLELVRRVIPVSCTVVVALAFASAMLRGYSGLAQVGCLAGILCFLSCESTTAVGFCPSCQGNAPSCTYATDGRCPVADTITANAGVIAGTAAAGTSLILSNVVERERHRADIVYTKNENSTVSLAPL